MKHDLHEAKRVFFQIKRLCGEKDAFYQKQATRTEKLLKHAFDQAKAFTALYEANEEAQEEAQEEKPWYDGDGDDPEGFFQIMQDVAPDCEWVDGDAGDVSVTSSDPSDSEEDIDDKMLAEPVVWTDEDEKRLAELKALNSGTIPVDADILNEMIEKKMHSKWA